MSSYRALPHRGVAGFRHTPSPSSHRSSGGPTARSRVVGLGCSVRARPHGRQLMQAVPIKRSAAYRTAALGCATFRSHCGSHGHEAMSEYANGTRTCAGATHSIQACARIGQPSRGCRSSGPAPAVWCQTGAALGQPATATSVPAGTRPMRGTLTRHLAAGRRAGDALRPPAGAPVMR